MLDVDGLGDIDAAKAASRDCPDGCGGEGLVTICHADYDGQSPVLEDTGPDGNPRRRLTRRVAYCCCAAGRWILSNHQADSKKMFAKIPDLYDIVNPAKGSRWSLQDPTEPRPSPGEVPARGEFAQMIADISRQYGRKGVQKVYPKSDGNRREAYREMAEPIPGQAPQTARDWRSLPPVPDVAAVPEMAAAFVPYGSEAPF